MKKYATLLIMIVIIFGILSGCNEAEDVKHNEEIPNVVATTTMLADIVNNIGGNYVHVERLMGPGIDPHLYKASAGDVDKMMNANLIIFNGLHLEGKMGDIFENLNKNNVNVIAVADKINELKFIQSEDFQGNYDPHIWFDVKLWIEVVDIIKDKLIEIDEIHKDDYILNTENYKKQLKELDQYVVDRVNEVPKSKRILITAHDAFNYFGNAYEFEVKGLQGISTASEAGTSDVKELADFISEREIPAIFVESSVPPKNIEALKAAVESRGFNVNIGGELFSDSLGDPDTEEGTYIGTVKHNVDTIVNALIK